MMPLGNPLKTALDRLYDSQVRSNYFRGVQFTDPPGDPGWFGPNSPVWYVHGHTPALFMGLLNSAFIEALSPEIAYGGRDHSRVTKKDADGNPIPGVNISAVPTRAGHSLAFFLATAFGPTKAAETAARAVRGMHSKVKGELPDGRLYDADNDPELFRWTYCTVVWGIATGHEFYHPRPLRGSDLDEYYRQYTRIGVELGGTDLPASKAEVADCLAERASRLYVSQQVAEQFKFMTHDWNPRPVRPITRQIEWVLLDMAPDWQRTLLRAGPRSGRIETKIRRAVMRSLLNSLYTEGLTREFRQSQDRVAAVPAVTNTAA